MVQVSKESFFCCSQSCTTWSILSQSPLLFGSPWQNVGCISFWDFRYDCSWREEERFSFFAFYYTKNVPNIGGGGTNWVVACLVQNCPLLCNHMSVLNSLLSLPPVKGIAAFLLDNVRSRACLNCATPQGTLWSLVYIKRQLQFQLGSLRLPVEWTDWTVPAFTFLYSQWNIQANTSASKLSVSLYKLELFQNLKVLSSPWPCCSIDTLWCWDELQLFSSEHALAQP